MSPDRLLAGAASAPATSPADPARPTLAFYTAPGCGLCHESRLLLQEILEERAGLGLPGCRVDERRIADDPAWEHRYLELIPVLAIGEAELPLATSRSAMRAFLHAALDAGLA